MNRFCATAVLLLAACDTVTKIRGVPDSAVDSDAAIVGPSTSDAIAPPPILMIPMGPGEPTGPPTTASTFPSSDASDPSRPPCTEDENKHRPVHTGTDIYGADGCQPVPARFLILGDSIAACAENDQAHCSPYLVAQYIQTHYAPALTVETHAKDGAFVRDLVGQAAAIEGGPGHLFVFVFAIGNDLLTGNFDGPSLSADYDKFLDVFADVTRFPGGVTFLLNTQYGPADQCAVPGASGMYTPALTQALIQTNHDVVLVPAESRDNVVAVDQYPDFLGHGQNANLHGCPYCGPDNTRWVTLFHPNAIGHAHLAAKWYPVIDAMLSPTCHAG